MTTDSRRQACEYLRVWKVRRQYLTPASVLSTLTILDVYLQDDCLPITDANARAASAKPTPARRHNMRKLYAHAFTRFLNYMSSILQTRQLKTMYSTAQQLGLDSFLVDLRHMCAHGHDLPALDVFQRTAVHLIEWLHEFYWRREFEHIEDASVADVRPQRAVDFEAYVESLLHVYDTAAEALLRRCRVLGDIKADGKPFEDAQQPWSLKKYGAYHKLDRLSVVLARVINELTELAAREARVRGTDQIFCTVVLRCRYLMASAAAAATAESAQSTQTTQQRVNELIAQHQNLFRSLAVCGFIETFFGCLVAICEDEHESEERRRGAQFWAEQVVSGFILFKEVKRAFRTRKERNAAFEMDLAPLNTEAMTPEIRELYKRLGVNCGGVLIFGDTLRRPWTLTFTREYMIERASLVNEYTRPVLEKCVELVEPALTAAECEHLRGLMAVYVESEGDVTLIPVEEELEVTGPVEMEAEDAAAIEDDVVLNADGLKTYGIWSEVSGEFLAGVNV